MIFPRVPELVSIVIPSYNYARYIEQCLESILQQTYKNLEIVIVDDASTDETCCVIEKWKQSLSKFTSSLNVITTVLPRHIGYAGTLTIGLFLTRGEFIAIQDADDLCAPTRIERQLKYLNEHSNIGLVGTNVEIFEDNYFDVRTPADWIEFGDDIKDSLVLGRPAFCLSSGMFRGEMFDALGGLTRLPLGMEDWEFVSKLTDSQKGIENLPDVLYYARRHSNQRSNQLQSGDSL